jgi:hypothetical protein
MFLFQNKQSEGSYQPPPISPGVFNEELQRNIEENAMLSKKVIYMFDIFCM